MTAPPRLALFIDGANLYAMTKALGFEVDYRRFLRTFAARGHLVRALYYTTIVEDQEYSSIRPLTDWLDYNGYSVVTRPGRETTDGAGRRRVRGSIDVALAVDAMELAPALDALVLVSGDGDFRRLVEAVQRRGVRVTVVSTVATAAPMIADELRRQADEFLDLATLIPQVGRDATERAPREAPPGSGRGADPRGPRAGEPLRHPSGRAPGTSTRAEREPAGRPAA